MGKTTLQSNVSDPSYTHLISESKIVVILSFILFVLFNYFDIGLPVGVTTKPQGGQGEKNHCFCLKKETRLYSGKDWQHKLQMSV